MKNIVITAGGTSERIDNVRKITNSSSGALGKRIAEEFLKENDVFIYYICSKNSLKVESNKVKIIIADSTFEVKEAIEKVLKEKEIDIFIHSMAISDYYVDTITDLNSIKKVMNEIDVVGALKEQNLEYKGNKISSSLDNMVLILKQTPKIISLIKKISPKTFLVGFKLLDGVSTEELINVGTKLKEKNKCDIVVANNLSNIRNGLHKAHLITNNGVIEASSKEDIAKKLVELTIKK